MDVLYIYMNGWMEGGKCVEGWGCMEKHPYTNQRKGWTDLY
jgi:hypothetical protein